MSVGRILRTAPSEAVTTRTSWSISKEGALQSNSSPDVSAECGGGAETFRDPRSDRPARRGAALPGGSSAAQALVRPRPSSEAGPALEGWLRGRLRHTNG